MTRSAFLPAAILTLGAAMATGVVFALWAENGPKMFLALVESGLAFCF